MNILKQIVGFWTVQDIYSLDIKSIALYLYLVNVCNECRRKNPFERRNDKIEGDLKITRNTLVKARNRLTECKLISFESQNGVSNVRYTLSNIDEVLENAGVTLSNIDEVENATLSKNDEVTLKPCENLISTLSKSDKVQSTLSQTLSNFDTLNIKEKNNTNYKKEINKEKEDSQPYENLIRSLIPTENEVIDFFMSFDDLKPSEAETLAKSFFSHFSAQGWRDGKSLIFDWVNGAKEWKISNGAICEPQVLKNEYLPEIKPKVLEIESKEPKRRFKAPSIEEVRAYCEEKGYNIDAEHFIAYYESIDWMRGKTKIKDWKMCIVTWVRNNKNWANNGNKTGTTDDLTRNVLEGIARACTNK